MSNVDPNTSTTYANLDWDHYKESRPPYPESLKSIIYDYRRAHSEAGWGRFVDVGGGSGISTTLFAADFKVVNLLDPSPLNLDKGRVFLGQWVERHDLQAKLEFTQSTAEEAYKSVKDASLVTCATAAHFVDPDSFVTSAAKMLHPSGTLAVYSYWVPFFPDQSKHFSDTYCRAVTNSIGLAVPPGDETVKSIFVKSAARIAAGDSVLDSVPAPEEYFKDVQRIRINPEAEVVLKTFGDSFPLPFEPIPSRVSDNEKQVCYNTGKDPQAEGWCFTVDGKWLHGFLATMRPTGIKLSDEQYKSAYGEWDWVFAEECPTGSTRALWPVNIVLATRK